ncbi:carnitine dehydratase [Rhodococcus sp. 06-621-2]|nr:carnitine dehydratase [Rhodococcus sp. 06-621-2]
MYDNYVSGKWVPGRGTAFEAINPYTERPWATIAGSSVDDVDDAVQAAHDTFENEWRRTSGYERGRLILRLAELIEDHATELARIETTDNGKVIRETHTQMLFAARNYRFFAGLADKLSGETKPMDDYWTFDYTVREPIGVVAVITAWNSPIALLANKLAPALTAGNTVVVKPSEFTSASTLHFAKLVEAAGFPPGVFNVITGAGDIGAALVAHPRVDKVTFTGSVTTGSRIAQKAAEAIVPVTLELGGKSANIVFPDADLDRAVDGAIAGIFAAAGQTCIAGSRLLVHESLQEQFVDRLSLRARAIRLGDPLDPTTEMGPLAHVGQLRKVLGDIATATSEGGRLVTGGESADHRGLFVEPTIFADVRNDMTIAQTEVFGPVLSVLPFVDEEHAVTIANDTDFGLAGAVWTSDLARAHRVVKELRCGTVWVNTYRRNAAQAPFGGIKKSGYGRERGIEALEPYMVVKNVMIDVGATSRDPFSAQI